LTLEAAPMNWFVNRLGLCLGDAAFLSDGNDRNRRFRGNCLGLVGDQLAQERNQYDERNTDREAKRGPFD